LIKLQVWAVTVIETLLVLGLIALAWYGVEKLFERRIDL
jgi:hypothetical protein